MTEILTVPLTDGLAWLTDTCIMLTVYDKWMTDHLQTGLATGFRTISHTGSNLYIYDSLQTVEP
jgi:hypothetical protein